MKGNAVFEEKKVGNPKEGVEEVEDSEVSARDGTWKEPRRSLEVWSTSGSPEACRKLKLVLHSNRGWRLLAEWDNMRGCNNKFDLGLESSQSLMAAGKGPEIVGL